jgi:hypothetical protein
VSRPPSQGHNTRFSGGCRFHGRCLARTGAPGDALLPSDAGDRLRFGGRQGTNVPPPRRWRSTRPRIGRLGDPDTNGHPTMITTLAYLPLEVLAVMVALPAFLAVMIPFLPTATIFVLEDLKLIFSVAVMGVREMTS